MKNINVPPGYVILEVRIPRKGPVKAQIVRDGLTQCSNGDDKRLIDGVLNGPLKGLGGKLGQTVDQGRTGEYWQQVKQHVPQLQPIENENDGGAIFGPKPPEKELDQGYGV